MVMNKDAKALIDMADSPMVPFSDPMRMQLRNAADTITAYQNIPELANLLLQVLDEEHGL